MKRLTAFLVLSLAVFGLAWSYDVTYSNMTSPERWLCDTGDLYPPHDFHDVDGDDATHAPIYSKGNALDDTKTLGSENDCVDTRGGHDTVYAGDGYDTVFGGENNDDLYLEQKADVADGGPGTDDIWGGVNGDIIYGGTGNDNIYGEGGDDDLFGGYLCTETNYYGFDAFDLDHDGYYDGNNFPNEYPLGTCGLQDGGNDTIYGGAGDDWLWDSNSDHVSDGDVDYLDGGGGYDYCAVGPEDSYTNCEVVNVLDQGPNT